MEVGISNADHAAPSTRKKVALTTPTRGGRSVGIVRSRTQATEFRFSSVYLSYTIHMELLAVFF
jgi:hypothetical protein